MVLESEYHLSWSSRNTIFSNFPGVKSEANRSSEYFSNGVKVLPIEALLTSFKSDKFKTKLEDVYSSPSLRYKGHPDSLSYKPEESGKIKCIRWNSLGTFVAVYDDLGNVQLIENKNGIANQYLTIFKSKSNDNILASVWLDSKRNVEMIDFNQIGGTLETNLKVKKLPFYGPTSFQGNYGFLTLTSNGKLKFYSKPSAMKSFILTEFSLVETDKKELLEAEIVLAAENLIHIVYVFKENGGERAKSEILTVLLDLSELGIANSNFKVVATRILPLPFESNKASSFINLKCSYNLDFNNHGQRPVERLTVSITDTNTGSLNVFSVSGEANVNTDKEIGGLPTFSVKDKSQFDFEADAISLVKLLKPSIQFVTNITTYILIAKRNGSIEVRDSLNLQKCYLTSSVNTLIDPVNSLCLGKATSSQNPGYITNFEVSANGALALILTSTKTFVIINLAAWLSEIVVDDRGNTRDREIYTHLPYLLKSLHDGTDFSDSVASLIYFPSKRSANGDFAPRGEEFKKLLSTLDTFWCQAFPATPTGMNGNLIFPDLASNRFTSLQATIIRYYHFGTPIPKKQEKSMQSVDFISENNFYSTHLTKLMFMEQLRHCLTLFTSTLLASDEAKLKFDPTKFDVAFPCVSWTIDSVLFLMREINYYFSTSYYYATEDRDKRFQRMGSNAGHMCIMVHGGTRSIFRELLKLTSSFIEQISNADKDESFSRVRAHQLVSIWRSKRSTWPIDPLFPIKFTEVFLNHFDQKCAGSAAPDAYCGYSVPTSLPEWAQKLLHSLEPALKNKVADISKPLLQCNVSWLGISSGNHKFKPPRPKSLTAGAKAISLHKKSLQYKKKGILGRLKSRNQFKFKLNRMRSNPTKSSNSQNTSPRKNSTSKALKETVNKLETKLEGRGAININPLKLESPNLGIETNLDPSGSNSNDLDFKPIEDVNATSAPKSTFVNPILAALIKKGVDISKPVLTISSATDNTYQFDKVLNPPKRKSINNLNQPENLIKLSLKRDNTSLKTEDTNNKSNAKTNGAKPKTGKVATTVLDKLFSRMKRTSNSKSTTDLSSKLTKRSKVIKNGASKLKAPQGKPLNKLCLRCHNYTTELPKLYLLASKVNPTNSTFSKCVCDGPYVLSYN